MKDFQILPTNKLVDRMNFLQNGEREIPYKRTLIQLVRQRFHDPIALWSPKYGGSFIFNNEVDKGQIIEVLCKQIDELKEKLSPIAIEDQVRNVGKAIRSEINSIPPTYRKWNEQKWKQPMHKQNKSSAFAESFIGVYADIEKTRWKSEKVSFDFDMPGHNLYGNQREAQML